MVRHKTRSFCEQKPRQKAAHKRVENAYPNSCNAYRPACFACVADKNYRRKIRRSVRKCTDPRTDISASEQKSLHSARAFGRVNAYRRHKNHENCQ